MTRNPDIGRIRCPISGDMAPVRRYATGQRLAYFVSTAGKIAPNLQAGQMFIYQNAEFNDEEDRSQIGRWLASRGVSLPNPEQPETVRRDEPEADPEMEEVVIGGSRAADPLRDGPEITVEPPPQKGGIFDWFVTDDDHE